MSRKIGLGADKRLDYNTWRLMNSSKFWASTHNYIIVLQMCGCFLTLLLQFSNTKSFKRELKAIKKFMARKKQLPFGSDMLFLLYLPRTQFPFKVLIQAMLMSRPRKKIMLRNSSRIIICLKHNHKSFYSHLWTNGMLMMTKINIFRLVEKIISYMEFW